MADVKEQLNWESFIAKCNSCQACDLAMNRTNAVVWRGAVKAPLLFVGEGPGANEDLLGTPFVGRSGKLLDRFLDEYNIKDDQYHIMNMVKCRPPGNRKPTKAECLACKSLLDMQIGFVEPKIIVLLGATAYNYFTGDKTPISKVRGIWQQFENWLILPTFHPSYLLRDPRKEIYFHEDFLKIKETLDEITRSSSD